MEVVYEFDGELFKSTGEYLDAVAHEYKHGDKDLAVQSLEDYGFALTDIHVSSEQPHPLHADDNAHASTPQADDNQDEEEE